VSSSAIASPPSGGTAAPPWSAAQTVALAVALTGAALMAAIASGAIYPVPWHYVGSHLYDLYAQALFVEHRWDLPMRDLKYEGHFTADGTGYLYYGLAPLVTRLFFMPFVELPTTWISSFSIWLWAVVGNAAYHRAFWLALANGAGGAHKINGWASALLACAVWFAAPGMIMSATGAVFDEPIAMTYALAGGFVLLIAKVSFGHMALERAVLPMALLAGITVHARPHLAVGLYLAVCLVCLAIVLRGGWPRWRRAIGAMAVLGAFGLALIAANVVRFGNPATVHGGFGKEDVQYSSIFWGLEKRSDVRARAFNDFGQFSPGRIVPNAMIYIAQPPSNLGFDRWVEGIEDVHDSLLPDGDHVGNAEPRVGVLYLWPAFVLLMVVGLFQRATWRTPAVAGLAGASAATLLIWSYLTITLRYHVDLWPLIAIPALFGLSAIASKAVADRRQERSWRQVMMVLATLGLFVTMNKSAHVRAMHIDREGMWSQQFCMDLAAEKGFEPLRAQEICARSSNLGGKR
jgi:hypothetical protein